MTFGSKIQNATRFLLIFFIIGLVSCSFDSEPVSIQTETEKNLSTSNRTIYSWNREIFEIEPEVLFLELEQNKIGTIYQGLYPEDFNDSCLKEIVRQYRNKGIEIAYLIGDSSWKDSTTVIHWALEPLVRFNNSSDSKIEKVCFDIEFFASKDGTSIEEYIAMMKGVYNYCHEHNLEVIVCLPYWIEGVYGKTAFLELLDYVDVLSCSIFYVEQEEKLVSNVLQLCREKEKPLEVIYELQPENEKYKVEAINTYYYKGLQAMINTSINLEQRFGVRTSMHNLSEYRNLYQAQ